MAGKVLILLAIIPLLLLPGGCWDRRETEDLLLVDSIVFGKSNTGDAGQYRVSFITTRPSSGGGGQMAASGEEGAAQAATQWEASSYGSTLEKAIRKLSIRSPRYIYLAHNRVIMFEEGLAREGISQAVDFLLRARGTRLRNYVLVVKGDKSDLLASSPQFEDTLAGELFSILETSVGEGDYYYPSDLNIIAQGILTNGQDPWAPFIETFSAAQTSGSSASQPVIIGGTALFKADRLVGYLDAEETQRFLLLKGLSNAGYYDIERNGKKLSYRYEQAKVRRRLTVEDGRVNVHFDVTLKGLLEEIHFYSNLSEAEIENLEKSLSAKAEAALLETVNKCKELGSDALGIGRLIHARKPEIWKEYSKNWHSIYPEIGIDIKVKAQITGTALGTKPIVPKTSE
ncbi:MAG: Ger(x)C family spore germination protein [Clostridia bacterium]|jgi:spore germination protein KC